MTGVNSWKELLAWAIVLATLALLFAGLGGAMSGVPNPG